MKFIEVKKGKVSIRVEDIISVEYLDDLSCTVVTSKKNFIVNYPYSTLIKILESDISGEEDQGRILKSMHNIMKTQGSFAG